MSATAALGLTVLLLVANGFFVAAEFALLAARRHRLEQLVSDGKRGAKAALAGSRELSIMLAAAQLGITMASLGLGIISEPAIADSIEPTIVGAGLPSTLAHVIAVVIALSIIVFLHLVVGEMAPKSWALAHPETAALSLAWTFRCYALVFRPVLILMNHSANAVVRLCGVEPREELAVGRTSGDLALIVRESAGHGSLEQEEGQLLGRALGLAELDARAVMAPRSQIVAVPVTADADEIETAARTSGRSRLPVYGDDLDDVRGIVHIKDVLLLEDSDRAGATAVSLGRPVLRVGETDSADDVLLRMRAEGQHVAVVTDEYGGVAGLIALEDLIEELIGDFEDETDPVRGPDASGLDGGLRPDEVERATGLRMPEGEFDTLAGWVLLRLRRIAAPGDIVKADGLVGTVLEVDGAKITRVALSRHGADGAEVERPVPQPDHA